MYLSYSPSLCITTHGKCKPNPSNHAIKFWHILEMLHSFPEKIVFQSHGHIFPSLYSFPSPVVMPLIKWSSFPVTHECTLHCQVTRSMHGIIQYKVGQQIVKIQVTIQWDFLSKMCQNFMAWLLGVVLHLPWVVIHNIKSTHNQHIPPQRISGSVHV